MITFVSINFLINISNSSSYRLKRQSPVIEETEIYNQIFDNDSTSSEIPDSEVELSDGFEEISEILQQSKGAENTQNIQRFIRNANSYEEKPVFNSDLDDLNLAETHIFRPVFRYKSRVLEKRKF